MTVTVSTFRTSITAATGHSDPIAVTIVASAVIPIAMIIMAKAVAFMAAAHTARVIIMTTAALKAGLSKVTAESFMGRAIVAHVVTTAIKIVQV